MSGCAGSLPYTSQRSKTVTDVKIGLRSKLLIAAFGLLTVAGCVPVGYYEQPAYGYGGTGVVVQYESYGRP
jgi:hypothetical protein